MNDRLEKIYVVFKTHFDIGFTGLVSDVVHKYKTEMLKDVIAICDKTKDNEPNEMYVWTMSAWPLLQSLQGSDEQDKASALKFMESGQLIWHLLPYTTHTEFCGLEEWIRGMYVSRGLSEKFGYRPMDAKMTDVPGHTWIVPSLLKKAGVNILHLGCNGFSTPPDVPPVFFWEGPDGERLLTFYSKGGYGTGILPPEEWTHPVWLALILTSDNHGPHEASVIEDMKASIAESGLQAELHIGSLNDFAADFLSRNPNLPVIRGDLADAWIHGVGSAPREVSRVRELRSRIAAAESALVLSMLSGETSDVGGAAGHSQQIKGKIDESYEHSLLFGEHTWGMDCKSFLFPRTYDKKSFLKDKSSERYLKMEHSWQEQIDYLNKAEAALDAAVEMLSGSGSNIVREASDKKTYRVYNYLGWSRDALVLLENLESPEEDEIFIDCISGEKLVWSHASNGIILEVKQLPALGYKTIACIRQAELQAAFKGSAVEVAAAVDTRSNLLKGFINHQEAVIENAFVRVQVDCQTGWITSLYDKKQQKEWVEETSSFGFGQYEYNIYSSEEITRYIKKYAYRFHDWGVHDFGKTDYPEQQKRLSFTTELSEIRLIEESDYVRLVCKASSIPSSVNEYGNANETVWSITLTEDSPNVDMEWKLTGKEETPMAESGHILFPLKLDNPSYRINKMGSVIDPCTDIVRSSSTLLQCCENFVDVSDGTVGMAIVPLDSPLFFIGRNGMWDYEHDYKPEKPEINFNLFNNWWGTNFPQWVGGSLSYRYRLIPHKGDWVEGSVWKQAQEAMTPVSGVPVSEEHSQTAFTDFLPNGLEGMAVTCLKPAEDGDGYILRLRDWLGQSREVTVGIAVQANEVLKTDLLEYEAKVNTCVLIESEDASMNQICFQTEPFEIHTFRIR
ncbi:MULTISPECIES: DUF5054 domain-containing protein [unclassified Paenibacillus]|uniref:DUF5054 domain-containing protein n=1 Tax=unclassified Paenibacillus TaxID=185978 RepID=UPI003637BA45